MSRAVAKTKSPVPDTRTDALRPQVPNSLAVPSRNRLPGPTPSASASRESTSTSPAPGPSPSTTSYKLRFPASSPSASVLVASPEPPSPPPSTSTLTDIASTGATRPTPTTPPTLSRNVPHPGIVASVSNGSVPFGDTRNS